MSDDPFVRKLVELGSGGNVTTEVFSSGTLRLTASVGHRTNQSTLTIGERYLILVAPDAQQGIEELTRVARGIGRLAAEMVDINRPKAKKTRRRNAPERGRG